MGNDVNAYDLVTTEHDRYVSIRHIYHTKPLVIDYDCSTAGPFMVFCPYCGKKARQITNIEMVNRILLDDRDDIEVMCACCGKMIKLDFSESGFEEGRSRHSLNRMAAIPIRKLGTFRWTDITLFKPEEDGKITAAMNYCIMFVNRKAGAVYPNYGAIKVTMDTKKGQTYVKNAKVFGRYASPSARAFNRKWPLKINCGDYTLESWKLKYYEERIGFMKQFGRLFDKLDEHEIVKFFAENLIKLRGIDRSVLTQKGDFSDTTFTMISLCNNAPYYSYNGLKDLAQLSSKEYGRKYVRRMNVNMRKGTEHAAAYFIGKKNTPPKSIARLIADRPFTHYIYETMKKAGFKNTDIIRRTMENTVCTNNLMILMSDIRGERSTMEVEQEVTKNRRRDIITLIRGCISQYGEKKTARLFFIRGDANGYCIRDLAYMYVRLPEDKRHLSGNTVKEMHDNIREEVSYVKFEYPGEVMRLEGAADGIEFSIPRDSTALSKISADMHNCVWSYSDKVKDGISTIVLMSDGKKNVGCIEIRGKEVVQALGPCNKAISPGYRKTLGEWMKKNGLTYSEHAVVGDFTRDEPRAQEQAENHGTDQMLIRERKEKKRIEKMFDDLKKMPDSGSVDFQHRTFEEMRESMAAEVLKKDVTAEVRYIYGPKTSALQDTVDGIRFSLVRDKLDMSVLWKTLHCKRHAYGRTRIYDDNDDLDDSLSLFVATERGIYVGCIEVYNAKIVRRALGEHENPIKGKYEASIRKWQEKHGLQEEDNAFRTWGTYEA